MLSPAQLFSGQTYQLGSVSSLLNQFGISAGKPSAAPAGQFTSPDQFVPQFATQQALESQLNRAGSGKKMAIELYPAYGNEETVTVTGRVVEAERISNPNAKDSWLTNLWRNVKMLHAEGQKNVQVEVNLNGSKTTVQADEDGMFRATLRPSAPLSPGYQFAQVSLAANELGTFSATPAVGLVAIQPKYDSSFGVITDIDDTIQKSDVPSKLKSIQTLLFRNSSTQEVIPGTPELYQALDCRSDGRIDGDVTYVSGSPVQIDDRIQQFLDNHHFPAGAMELKKMGFNKAEGETSPTETYNYKLERIRREFETFPDKKFYLFGDSGQKDPEVYTELAKEYPGRVLGIYINNVTGDQPNAPRYQAAGIKLTNSAADAAQDLFAKGVLTADDVARVQQAVQAAAVKK